MLEEDTKDIESGCKKATRYFKERERMHWFEWGSKYAWISFRIPALQEILLNFDKSTERIDKKVNLLLVDAQERVEASKKASDKQAEKRAAKRHKKLEEKIEKLLAAQKADADARNMEAKATAKLIELLTMGKKDLQHIASGKGEGKQKAEEVVDELMKLGMKRKEAKKKLEATLAVVRSENKLESTTLKRAAADEASKGVHKNVTAIATVDTETESSRSWILCVDGDNGRKLSPVPCKVTWTY